jgi:hypothetical protein
MGLLRWLERRFVTGEVMRDYGSLGPLTGVPAPGQVSLLLCKRRGQFQLVLRTSTHFELHWYPVKVSAALAAKLAEVAEDVRRVVQAQTPQAIPERCVPAETTAIWERRGSAAGERLRGEGTA